MQRPLGTSLSLTTNGVKPFVCPSDSSISSNIPAGGPAVAYAATSYAANYLLFGGTIGTGSVLGLVAKYSVGNIPDGTSNTVAMTERFGYNSVNGYNNSAWVYFTYASTPLGAGNSATFGFTTPATYPPQVGVTPNKNAAGQYSPSSAHASLQALLMDGSVRGVSASVSATTWGLACTPDDGNVLPSNW